MTRIGAPSLTAPAPASDAVERLRQTAQQLEGVFVEQLFKAMRETVPADGALSGGAGEEIFSSLLDQHLSEAVPASWDHGLAAAVVARLRERLPATDTPSMHSLSSAPDPRP